MYDFFNNIRIRSCDELSFLINISNNSILVLKTKTLEYLELKLKEGLTKEKLKTSNPSFIKFVNELEKQNILEVREYEI